MDSSAVTSIEIIISFIGMFLLFGLPIWLVMFFHFKKENQEHRNRITQKMALKNTQIHM